MKGYLNLFEGACDLVGDITRPMEENAAVTLLQPPHQNQKATLCRENGSWQLQGENFTIDSVQGTMVEA